MEERRNGFSWGEVVIWRQMQLNQNRVQRWTVVVTAEEAASSIFREASTFRTEAVDIP
jgi:hypothetical protein